jgi:ubiquinone/menaquinone biosynthesis C-methylase UbiE
MERIMSNAEKEIVRQGYNAIAARYLAERTEDSADVQLLRELEQRLPPGAKILDAGCGAGVPVTKRLSENFSVTGVDFSEAQIRLARQLVPRARFTLQDITRLSFPDATFDAICSYYAIIHIPRNEHPAILRNFFRILRPSGWALLCLGANDLESDVAEDYLGSRMYWSHYDSETNLRMLRESGFILIESTTVADSTAPGSGHLFVLVQKPRL